MKFRAAIAVIAAAGLDQVLAIVVECPIESDFRPLSAGQFIEAANPGWNAGNTLDAVPNEGSWNNAPLQNSTLTHVKAAGYKSVRIPVTYADHFVSGSPEWKINSTWLQRVSDVVDMATSQGLYVITNMHHDSWSWADVSKPDANQTMIQEKFYASWLQIAKTLSCKSAMVAFEPINEPPGTTEEHAGHLDKLNKLFLKALGETGGYNSQRVVTLSNLGMGADRIQLFKRPENITNPWAYQFHFYSPYDFIFSAWGKTVWGSPADKAAVVAELTSVRGNFSASDSDVPILLGEFDASQLNLEPAARWKWFDFVVRTAKSLGMTTVLWDNGLDNLDRQTGIWRDKIAVDITMAVLRGENNSLADSTTDASATTQESSAYAFNKVGNTVTDKTLPFIMNGNNFTNLTLGSTLLKEGEDYTLGESAVTLKQAFLSKYLHATAEPGTKANITVSFSAGAQSQIELVQWDVPTLSWYSVPAKEIAKGSDLQIPITWKGLHRVAAVKIATTEGAYLFDDWTQYLPDLQKGRGTFNSQWNFDHDRVIITKAAVEAVVASGKNTTFTFEFYPRAAGNGNVVQYTLTA
ncbi:glycoside hydrolase superfamily [Cercophora newfieldiana]|uniref:Glycoside hydrolase superfamily n=1 Tax=Cercophora newfieldiana TaxID=92897 RepID=A0AA40CUX0_9PEZI|nr:glycoside hydrolase superfamily [Cercophora newfieldiana]